jgi:hypothetical protein
MRTIVLNNNNVVQNGQNNTLVYNFPGAGIKIENCYVAVASVSMYYSWFNIASIYGNTGFSYTWADGVVYPITIPDGLYEVSTLNQFLQYEMIKNGHYLIDKATGQNVYFLEILVNDARYKVQVNQFVVPTLAIFTASLATDYTAPTGFDYSPVSVVNVVYPGINFGYNGSTLGTILGFVTNSNVTSSTLAIPSPWTFSAASPTAFSSTTPNIQPNSSVLVSVSNVDNPYASPTSIIYSITPSVAVGTIIADKPPQLLWNKLINGQLPQLRVSLLGTDLRPLPIQDGAMTIILAIAEEVEALGVMFDRK